MTKSRVTLD